MLPVILPFQNARLLDGIRQCLGQPCQKQPSTNTATQEARKTKSGRTFDLVFETPLPGARASSRRATCLRQPVMPAARISRASRTSVSRFPRERMRLITSLRLALEKMSGMGEDRPAETARQPQTRISDCDSRRW